MNQANSKRPEPRSSDRTNWAKLKWPLIALGCVLLLNLFFSPGFFHIEIKEGRIYGSLIDVLQRSVPVTLLAAGMTLVIATGGVDLSVGAVMAVTGSVAALLVAKVGYPFPAVLTISLFVGTVAGVWNGVLVAFLEVQPIVATLILMVAGRGIAQLLTNGQIITFENSAFTFLGAGSLFGLPFAIFMVVLVYLFTVLVVRKTATGLFIEAVGDNETAARIAGVNTLLVKVAAYSFCGFVAGMAGLIAASNIKAADANNAGLWLELDAILAVVIGGTNLTGGRFYLVGSLVGALIIQALTTTILTRGIPVEFTLVLKAIVIIGVCLLQSETFRQSFGWRSNRSRTKDANQEIGRIP